MQCWAFFYSIAHMVSSLETYGNRGGCYKSKPCWLLRSKMNDSHYTHLTSILPYQSRFYSSSHVRCMLACACLNREYTRRWRQRLMLTGPASDARSRTDLQVLFSILVFPILIWASLSMWNILAHILAHFQVKNVGQRWCTLSKCICSMKCHLAAHVGLELIRHFPSS
jgi:hypothetical protein